MRRIFCVIMATILPVFLMVWLLNGAASIVAASSGEETPDHLPTGIELEILEAAGNPVPPPPSPSLVTAAANLTDVYRMPDYATVTDLLPRVIITKGSDELAPGYYFVTTFQVGKPVTPTKSMMIVNNKAQLVYYQQDPINQFLDLKVLHEGALSFYKAEANAFQILDSSYTISESWLAGNGFPAVDGHDFQLLANGNVAFMIYASRQADLTSLGGKANAQVFDLVIQEMDPEHHVVFEWNSRDHFLITDTYISLTTSIVDYAHGNAIEEDNDGNFLVSNRHMSEITKIDRQTGAIIWRLGGKNNQFTFIGDTTLPNIGGFSFQHDIRRLPNGHITLFDDGNQFIDAHIRESRGVEYAIDEVNKTVTLVKEFRTIPDTRSTFMGSMQRLPNGNTIVGWGGVSVPEPIEPVALSEFNPDGDVVLNLGFLDSHNLSYRGYKFPWHGFPASDPLLVAIDSGDDNELRYSWNGATDVNFYSVLGGSTPLTMTMIAQQPKSDFEEATPLADVDPALCFFKVVPFVEGQGNARASNVVYGGNKHCDNGLAAGAEDTASRTFTFPQTAGNITTTLTVSSTESSTPTVILYSDNLATAASIPAGQFMSNVRFSLTAYAGATYSQTTELPPVTTLSIQYGALDLSRNPDDVNLLRWDEATQSWSDEGVTLLQREIVGRRVTYALSQVGDFALFVANQQPESSPATFTLDEDEQINFAANQFAYFDTDGDDFATLVVASLPLSGSLTYDGAPVTTSQVITVATLPLLAFTPSADENGLPYTAFAYQVSDGFTQSVAYTATILVRAVNDAPIANDDEAISNQATAGVERPFTLTIPVLTNDIDVDGDALQIVGTTPPLHGTATVSGKVIVYRATPTYNGADSFSYTVDDGHGSQATATVTLDGVPRIPQFLPQIGH